MSNQIRFLLPHPQNQTLSPNSSSILDSNNENNKHCVDTDFDSYWEEEARTPHRNRIRIGRQYQATVPRLLKADEKDPRKLEELESLSYCPKRSAKVSNAEIEHYFTIAKSLNLFASLVKTRSLLGRDVTIADLNHIRNKEGLSLASVIKTVRHSTAPTSSTSTSSSITSASISSSTTQAAPSSSSSSAPPPQSSKSSSSGQQSPPQKPAPSSCTQISSPIIKALSQFISLHHPCHQDQDCKKTLIQVESFAKAIEACGKKFNPADGHPLPSKSSKNILENFYIGSSNNPERSNTNIRSGNEQISTPSKQHTANSSKTNAPEIHQPKVNKPDSTDQVSSNAKNSTTPSNLDGLLDLRTKRKNMDARMSVYNFDEELKSDSPARFDCPKPGTEVRPLKAKPMMPNASLDADDTNSNAGSLKFFMDGQLVLKLNACQSQPAEKCHWVQSGDKVTGTNRQKKYIKRSTT